MKNIICILAFLLLPGCYQVDDNKYILMNLKANGEIELIPDMASIYVNIYCVNKGLVKSNACTKEGIDALFALLDKYKVEKSDYHSSRIELEKEYIWKRDSQVFNGYKSSSQVSIVFRDLAVMEPVIAHVMQMKNADMGGLNYSHSKLDTYTREVYLKALENSKQLANDFKDEIGGASIEILRISNESSLLNVSEPVMAEKMESKPVSRNYESSPSVIQMNPGTLSLSREIYVQYRIEIK